MSAPSRSAASQLRHLQPLSASVRTMASARSSSTKDEQWPQRTPLGPYYTTIMRNPTPSSYAQHKPNPSIQPAHEKPQITASQNEETVLASKSESPLAMTTSSSFPSVRETKPLEKARLVFFSPSLAGPAEQADRLASKQAKSTDVAGVLVPPRPEEPDNCCMSGCVNCVWDRYRDDMEEWAAKKGEAQARLEAGEGNTNSDDGGCSGANWKLPAMNDKIAKDTWDDEIYKGVPVGISEFMKQEKRLKEKHLREGTVGG